MLTAFGENGRLDSPAIIADNAHLALSRSLGTVEATTSGKLMIGYDDLFSIQYFHENLRPCGTLGESVHSVCSGD